jgi:hypothetical protein
MNSECDVYVEQLHILPTFRHCELKLSVHSQVVLTVLSVDRSNVSASVAFPLAFLRISCLLCALSSSAVVGSNVLNLRPKNICAGDSPISEIFVLR